MGFLVLDCAEVHGQPALMLLIVQRPRFFELHERPCSWCICCLDSEASAPNSGSEASLLCSLLLFVCRRPVVGSSHTRHPPHTQQFAVSVMLAYMVVHAGRFLLVVWSLSVVGWSHSAAQGGTSAEGPASSGEGGVRVGSTSPAQEPTGSGVLFGPAWRVGGLVSSSYVDVCGLSEP
jgi:hypothetical protein